MISHNGARGEFGPNRDCGKHFFSETGYENTWDCARLEPLKDYMGGCAYERNISFVDGFSSSFYRRERPQVIFDKNGNGPLGLSTSAIDTTSNPSSGNDASYTVVVGVNQNK